MSSIEAVSGVTDSTPAPRVENPGALLDRDAFLKLLVAQLKYQDPTKPADTSQMLAQSAQLTMVDRLNEMAEAFATSNATQQLSLAGTMVGREITFVGHEGGLTSQTVTSARIGLDGLVLVTADYEVPYDAVSAVAAPAAPAAAAPSGTGTTTTAAADTTTSADTTTATTADTAATGGDTAAGDTTSGAAT